jgi:hypothetical protein
MNRTELLQIIDAMWTDLLELKPANMQRSAMDDPGSPQAYPSSANLISAFKNHGYCFRCDSRAPDSVAQTGFRRRYEFDPPDDVKETLPHRAARGTGMAQQLGMWKGNRDALSEMVICVSRQMRGCTKFPSSDYVGPAWIYAIKLPANKLGFDTEHWQVQLGNSLWKPGEKAFLDIQPSEILASVPIQKSAAAAANEYFRFQVLSNEWTWHNADDGAKAHLRLELRALYAGGAVQSIMQNEDFLLF